MADLATLGNACERTQDHRALIVRLAIAAGERARGEAARQAPRAALWAPVAVGVGAAAYFSLKTEPSAIIAPALLLLLAAAAWRASAPAHRFAWSGAALIALGFLAADVRTAGVDAPRLSRDLDFVDVVGRLVAIEEGARGRRLTIETERVERLAAAETPSRVRVSWRGEGFAARPGDRIRIRAGLTPPPPPATPGGYDFARQLYFQRIGAVGYAVSPPRVLAPSTPSALDGGALDRGALDAARAAVERVRVALARRIATAAPGEGGGVVAAVVTGKRAAVSDRAETALRDSGLAHLLAISGLHMGLAAGLIFFGARFAMALSERLALHAPIKKWAAAVALAGSFVYLLLSGGGWSARRAFIMTAVMFAAILVDRRALSLRNVAIAAGAILITTPEAILQPGFQMSFAAVTVLIAAYEWARGRAARSERSGAAATLRRYFLGVAATDTLAALATAPYGLFHFHRAAIYSLPANLAASPIMAFWIMPAAIAALILAPIGLDGPFWRLAAGGVDWVLAVARGVSGLDGAIVTTPHWRPAALGAFSLTGLWFCLIVGPARWLALAATPLILAVAPAPRPVAFVADSGGNLGIFVSAAGNGDGSLAVYDRRRDRFSADAWKEAAGLDPVGAPTLRLRDVARCDAVGCAVDTDAGAFAVSISPLSLADDCERAQLVIALYAARRGAGERCAARLIDRRAVWRAGAHGVYLGPDGRLEIKTVAAARGRRPWSGSGPTSSLEAGAASKPATTAPVTRGAL